MTKPSEIFEGEGSSLKQAFDSTVTPKDPIESVVESFNQKFPLSKFLALSGGKGVERDLMNDWLRETFFKVHLQAKVKADKEIEVKHFAWCPQCGDALEQTGTKNQYNCFGCDKDYELTLTAERAKAEAEKREMIAIVEKLPYPRDMYVAKYRNEVLEQLNHGIKLE